MTAADDKFCNIFPNFRKIQGMIFHENRLPADDSHEISCLILFCYTLRVKIFLLLPLVGILFSRADSGELHVKREILVPPSHQSP